MYNSYLTNLDYNAGIYIRLSQEDKDKKYESDSESVVNQRQILNHLEVTHRHKYSQSNIRYYKDRFLLF